MTQRTAIQMPQKVQNTPTPTSDILQRQCACGNYTVAGGECAECRKKRLQRKATGHTKPEAVPPIVPAVLHSPGQLLDAETQAFMEPRFGRDFSRIPTHPPAVGVIQTKLAINKPGDEYEQEADRVADQVMAAPAHHAVSGAPPRIQRFSGQSSRQLDATPASVAHALASPGRPLEPALRQDMEQRFGYDFSRVRVHSGAAAAVSARDVNAHAYTVGQDIVFGADRFAPKSRKGGRLLAHELTHVMQQSEGAEAVQRQLGAPDPRAEAVAEAEAFASRGTEQVEAEEAAEEALKLNSRRRNEKSYAWSLGMKDRARLQKSLDLSPELRQEIAVKIRFFRGEAKAAYIQTISPALQDHAEQVSELLAGPAVELTCPGPTQFQLKFEGEPAKSRCMDLRTDPELDNYFDHNIMRADGYAVEATTWENIEYDRFKVMLVTYKNGKSEYFILDDIGNFSSHYDDKTSVATGLTFLKRENGLVYPVHNDRIIFQQALTPNMLSYKNGLEHQIKELKDLYHLLQVGGTFGSILGAYGAGAGPFKTAINAFQRSTPATLPGRLLPGRIRKIPKRALQQPEEEAGKPSPKSTTPAKTPAKQTGKIKSEEAGGARVGGRISHLDRGKGARPFYMNDPKRPIPPPTTNPKLKKKAEASKPPADDLGPGEGLSTKKPRKNRGADDDLPRKQRISDRYDKPELEQSPELIARLPDADHRRLYMKWLQKGHQGTDHPHINPANAKELDASLQEFSAEMGIKLKIRGT